MNDYRDKLIMNDYRDDMFVIPLFHVEVRDWKNKKEQLKDICNRCNLRDKDYIKTDFYDQKEIYVKDILYILNEELNIFANHFNFKNFNMRNAWFEDANKQNFHGVHNHGSHGYSAVCYIDYDYNEHTATHFISPFNSFLDGTTLYHAPNVNEGSLIFFPAVVNHYTLPNESEKERLILSFNLNVS